MFRGNRIDVMTRDLMRNDAKLRHLESNYTNGPDFVNPVTGEWWYITTPEYGPRMSENMCKKQTVTYAITLSKL